MKPWPFLLFLLALIPIVRAESLMFEVPISANDTPRVLSDYHPSDAALNSEAGEAFLSTRDFTLSRAVFEIQRLSSSVTVSLQAVLYSSLSGTYGSTATPASVTTTLATSGLVLASTITAGSNSQVSFYFNPAPTLLENRQYAVSVTMGTTGTIDLGYQVYFDGDNGYAGNLFIYQNGAYTGGANDHGVQLYGTPVEGFQGQPSSPPSSDQPSMDQPPTLPVVGGSTLLIVGVGLGAYLLVRGRKRGVSF